jgi:hypothetical protein
MKEIGFHTIFTHLEKKQVFSHGFHTAGVFFENIFTFVILIVQLLYSFEGKNCASVKTQTE